MSAAEVRDLGTRYGFDRQIRILPVRLPRVFRGPLQGVGHPGGNLQWMYLFDRCFHARRTKKRGGQSVLRLQQALRGRLRQRSGAYR